MSASKASVLLTLTTGKACNWISS